MNRSAPSLRSTLPAGDRPADARSGATLPRVSDPARSLDPARAADILKQARAS